MNSKWLILVGTGALSFSAACSSDGTPSYGSAGASAQAGATAPSAGGAGASSAGAPPTAGAGGSVAGAPPTAGAAGSLVTAGAGGAGGSSVAGAGGAGGAAGGSAAGASGAGGGSAGGGSCVTTLGKAMKFDGTVIDLVTGDLGTDFPGGDVPRTIELWAKFLGSQSWKAEGSMIETGLAVGGNNKVMGIDLSGYSGTTAQFGPYTNGYSDNNNPNGVFVMNTPQMGWLHLSWSYTGNHGKFSFTVNGMEYPIKTMAGDPTLALTQGIVTLGGSQSFGFEGWSGVMDEVKLWSVAKTPAEINANMRVVLKGTEPGLVAYYRFDEGSGTFTDDVTKKASHRLSTCSATNGRCRSANNGSPTWVDSDVPGTFTCAP